MANRDPKLLTQAAYARHREERGLPGGTREAVRKAIAAGDVSAFGPDKLIDPELADQQWARNRRARISPQAEAAGRGDLVDQAGGLGAAASPAPAPAPMQPPPAPVADTGYTAARARREQAEADLAEMTARKMRGDLVAWDDVARGGFELGRDLRDTMQAAENALAAELASESSADRCAEVLRRHHRAVCEVLVKSWREKIGPVPAGVAPA